ncbi:DUF2798 domain-containing protein [Polaribacter cellanae]|uniref:DUF2798 domain-containing protein n=1 Tax=Polaribacter cellanae TaxID=2818493 RepID=A0A975CP57_9FLAO|nr:DUF2798 domain-containing protein [Polaribacter cellanae]QTE21297.1 DUF2798 domain-containing protein [Polaribacter cellanae]
MNLTEKQTKIIFGILMAFFMALAMSFIMVLINVGVVKAFLPIWMKSFAIGFVVAVPTSMVAAPISQKFISTISKNGK